VQEIEFESHLGAFVYDGQGHLGVFNDLFQAQKRYI
jgi:hypothetical protein